MQVFSLGPDADDTSIFKMGYLNFHASWIVDNNNYIFSCVIGTGCKAFNWLVSDADDNTNFLNLHRVRGCFTILFDYQKPSLSYFL